MTKILNIKWLYLGMAIIALGLFSCVPARQVEELKSKYNKCENERNALSAEKAGLETENNELKAEIEDLKRRMAGLTQDTLTLGTSLRKMTRQYDKINKLNDELLKKQSELASSAEAESQKLLRELQDLQEALQRKEDDLRALELELNRKRTNLDKLTEELAEREKRVNELEAVIAQKDAKVNELKQKVQEALLGFKGKGIAVEQRNGKIYVSMEAQLLFAKGSTKVDQGGKQALIDLAKVLEQQEDIEILVEGHTDTDKMSGQGAIKDNWDLSVMRATSVVRIMLENSAMDAKMVTAAGRGEFMPVDPADTEEAKAKNRRIEVILTPNLDELFEIIDSDG